MIAARRVKLLPSATVFLAVALGLTISAARAEEADEASITWSEPARLAVRSLLLDVTSIGSTLVAVGDRGNVLLSIDGGRTWEQVQVPTRAMLTAVRAVGDKNLWAVGHDATIIHSGDGGRTWKRQFYAPEDEAPLLDVWFESQDHGLAVGAYGLALETRDGGASWDRRTIDEDEPHLNAIAETPDGTLFIAAEIGLVFRSRDRGASWDRIETGYGGSLFGVLPLRAGPVLVFGLRGHVFRSDDGGESWQAVETGSTAALLGGLQRADDSIVLVGLSGSVLVSRDGGGRFRAQNRADRNAIATVAEVGPGSLILFGEAGVCPVGDSLTADCFATAKAGGDA